MKELVKELKDAITTDKSTKPYDTTAKVVRTEGDTIWVHIDGGVDETPVAKTISAKAGDIVKVRVSGGSAWIQGNESAPPTDDTLAIIARENANAAQVAAHVASDAAKAATEDAGTARTAAAQAVEDAAEAKTAADTANGLLEDMQDAAEEAGTTLTGIYADAAEAKETVDEINAYADTAGKTVTQILNDGETAGTAAREAKAAATNASEYAARALGNLSTVQNVTETLNWITAHGTMALTSDIELDPTHVYFVQDNNGDYTVGGTKYAVVTEPDVADISTYYELSINQSLNNYVGTHLAVTSEGLWLIPEEGATPTTSSKKILIAVGGTGHTYEGAGTYIIEKVNNVDTIIAKFTEDGAQIGRLTAAHSIIDENGQRFYGSDGTTQLANIGYGEGQSQSGTATAPYYTFGTRQSNSTIGNFSLAEGYNTNASGYASHAEGFYTKASGQDSHAEGHTTEARGHNSHAEGGYSTAVGWYSHVQNIGTIAGHDNQTAIGKFNDNQTDTAFEIGNGTSAFDEERSNAFDVAWGGETRLYTPYSEGSSSTASGTTTKVVTASGFTLKEGAIVAVTFTNANTGSVSLNVNNTGSKYAYYNGSRLTQTNGNWAAGDTVLFRYDGTYYQKIDGTTSGTTYSSTDADLIYSLQTLGWTSDVIE